MSGLRREIGLDEFLAVSVIDVDTSHKRKRYNRKEKLQQNRND